VDEPIYNEIGRTIMAAGTHTAVLESAGSAHGIFILRLAGIDTDGAKAQAMFNLIR
jgi:hypothetical protein